MWKNKTWDDVLSFVTFAGLILPMPFLQPFRPFLCLFFCCAISLPLHAQKVLEGHLRDKDHTPVPFAVLSLQNATDSTLIETTLSDTLGYYRINTSTIANRVLRIIASGYTEQWKRIDDTVSSVQQQDFILSRSTAKSLAGVTVTSNKPLIERRVDRTIFNVENSSAAVGGDALDALKRAPGVRVQDNSISIAGKSTVNVLINDKLQQLSGDELANVLKSIPADNLARIEIITTPPAKYDAAGNAGLINIVTKKMLKNGLNGAATLSYTQRTSRAGSFNSNFNYRQSKLNVFGFANAYRSNGMPYLSINTQYSDQRWEQHSDVTNNNVFNRVQLGADYNLSPRSVIGFLYTLGNGGDQYNGDALITANAYNLHTHHIDSFITTRALTQDRGLRNVGNLNYQWKADSGDRKVNVDLDYFNRTGKAKRNLNTNNYFEDGIATGLNDVTRTSGIQQIDIRSGKVDVEWPVSFARLTFGGKASFIHNTSDNLFEYLADSVYQVDAGKTNRFDYRENTQAAYISAQKNFGKWETQIGLRAEYTQTKSHSATLNETARNEYFKLFPTVYVQYSPDENNALNINYSKRIDCPDFWSMNPFRSYFTASSYSQGNPFLQPSFSNNIELGYTLKSKYSFTLYAQLINNLQTRVSFIDTATKSYSFNMANVGEVKNYGATISATLIPAKWWECVVTGNGWYNSFSSVFYGNGQQAYSKPAYSIETSNTLYLNKAKTLIVSLNFTYNSLHLDDFDVVSSNYVLETGIKALLLQKRLIFALNGYDLLRSEQNRLENQYNGTAQYNYYDERSIRFGVTWKFGSNDIKAKRERNAGSEEEGRAR